MRYGQRRQQVSLPAPAPRIDLGIVGRTFHALIVAVIAAVPILVPFMVRFVVALFETYEIAQCEAIVGRREVYARPGPAPGMFEQVARAVQAAGEFRQLLRVTAPKAANGITIAVVPLAPAGGKSAELIAARADVPGFGDQFDTGKYGILGQSLEKRRDRRNRVLAAQNGCQIETEAATPISPPNSAGCP